LFREVIYWRRQHLGKWKLREKDAEERSGRRERKMIDLVIKGGDLIRDRHHPREPKHW
jgi:hypothetical protein